MSNDPALFNGSIANMDAPIAPRRAATAIARMRAHHTAERGMREDRIQQTLNDAWLRVIADFKAEREP